MTLPPADKLYQVVEATWPPHHKFHTGPWTIRDGAGGGKRVSSATAEAPVTGADLYKMEEEMGKLGQPPLVMIRAGEEGLDSLLAQHGYSIVDSVLLYAAPLSLLTGPLPPVSAFTQWPRLAITDELWIENGTGPERLAIMTRAAEPKAAVLARTADKPAGAAFVAIHDKAAMIHAIEVVPALRRKGTARNILRAAANWAHDLGATHLSLAVTEQNQPARALYTSLGLRVVGHYHYRIKEPRKA